MTGSYKFPYIIFTLFIILCISCCSTFAQDDYNGFKGYVIDTVIIVNNNIYDIEDEKYDQLIFRMVNKLHVKTKKSTIDRELLFKEGDLFDPQLADEISRNIRRNLAVFDAYIKVKQNELGNVDVYVFTIDQWSLIGSVNFTREGNENTYNISLEERNFLGFNQFLAFNYFNQQVKDDFVNFQYKNRRLLGNPVTFSWFYSNNEMNNINYVLIGNPYYSLLQKHALLMSFESSENQWEGYIDDNLVSSVIYNRKSFSMNYSFRRGSYSRKVTYSFAYDYTEEEVTNVSAFNNDYHQLNLPRDSSYHQVGAGLGFADYDFKKLYRMDGYLYPEDYTLGFSTNIFYSQYYNSDFSNRLYNKVNASITYAKYLNNFLIHFSTANSIWYAKSVMLRNLFITNFSLYNNASNYITFVLNGNFTYDWLHNNDNLLLLGGRDGLRGFGHYFKTGNKMTVFHFESRFFSGWELLSVSFGAAVFADVGGIWKSDEDVNMGNFFSSYGAGLRLYPERVSNNNIIRIDFAYSRQFDWSVSVSSHQYFSLF